MFKKQKVLWGALVVITTILLIVFIYLASRSNTYELVEDLFSRKVDTIILDPQMLTQKEGVLLVTYSLLSVERLVLSTYPEISYESKREVAGNREYLNRGTGYVSLPTEESLETMLMQEGEASIEQALLSSGLGSEFIDKYVDITATKNRLEKMEAAFFSDFGTRETCALFGIEIVPKDDYLVEAKGFFDDVRIDMFCGVGRYKVVDSRSALTTESYEVSIFEKNETTYDSRYKESFGVLELDKIYTYANSDKPSFYDQKRLLCTVNSIDTKPVMVGNTKLHLPYYFINCKWFEGEGAIRTTANDLLRNKTKIGSSITLFLPAIDGFSDAYADNKDFTLASKYGELVLFLQ